MRKLIASIKKYPKSFIIASIIATIIGLTVFLVFYFAINKQTITGLLNGTGVAGAVLILFFGLTWLARAGSFDTISYGFGQMFTSMFARKANKYNDFADYKEQKNTKREVASLSYFSYLFVGLLFLIAFAILQIVYASLYFV